VESITTACHDLGVVCHSFVETKGEISTSIIERLAAADRVNEDLRQQLASMDAAMFFAMLRMREKHRSEMKELRDSLAFAQEQIYRLTMEFCPERAAKEQIGICYE
jgi:cyanate lyase